jgi:hypothetical protein
MAVNQIPDNRSNEAELGHLGIRMAHVGQKYGWVSAAALIAGFWSCLAFATLGEPESSIGAETQLGHASIKQTDRGTYRVHEMQQPSGTLIREYVGPDGKVFAVTWHGPFLVNLRQTLGVYFDEYAAEARGGRQDRNHVQVRTDDLVVQVGGHMRAYHGVAYLPQALPSGVTVGDLQ